MSEPAESQSQVPKSPVNMTKLAVTPNYLETELNSPVELADEKRLLTTRHGEARESVYCAVAQEAQPTPTKKINEL